MAPKNKKIEEAGKESLIPEISLKEVDMFFAKYGNYRMGSGPTVGEMYQMFEARRKHSSDLDL